jgi:hypothetical protein
MRLEPLGSDFMVGLSSSVFTESVLTARRDS